MLSPITKRTRIPTTIAATFTSFFIDTPSLCTNPSIPSFTERRHLIPPMNILYQLASTFSSHFLKILALHPVNKFYKLQGSGRAESSPLFLKCGHHGRAENEQRNNVLIVPIDPVDTTLAGWGTCRPISSVKLH